MPHRSCAGFRASLGPTLGEWLREASPGKRECLAFICSALGLTEEVDPTIRYQLLHRAASAVVEADRFMTTAAAMMVHSFSPEHRWFSDFERFAALFGAAAARGVPIETTLPSGKPLYLGWAIGDQAFRAA